MRCGELLSTVDSTAFANMAKPALPEFLSAIGRRVSVVVGATFSLLRAIVLQLVVLIGLRPPIARRGIPFEASFGPSFGGGASTMSLHDLDGVPCWSMLGASYAGWKSCYTRERLVRKADRS